MSAPLPPLLFTITGTNNNDTLTALVTGSTIGGLDGADTLIGLVANDALVGGNGADSLVGGEGNDSLWGEADNDTLDGGSGDDMLSTGTGFDVALGGEGNDTIWGSVAVLVAGGLAPTLSGGNGADVLWGSGLQLGGEGADSLAGNISSDTLDGGTGADTMAGGAGDDIYYVDEVGDRVSELAGGGFDVVFAAVSFSLAGQWIERLVLTGAAALTGTGNSQANHLIGNASTNRLLGLDGADTLDGGAGADTLDGGTGDDTFHVDDLGDRVIELTGGGFDHVFSSVSFNMGGNELERLTLTGVAAITGTGNSIANHIIGNGAANRLLGLDGADTLDGGAGADTMEGGTGDDTFYVDNVGDRVIELAGAGFDQVFSSVSLNLAGQWIERLTLTGALAINATGNSQPNQLIGNAAANRMDGLGGADTMEGGGGNDTYYVDNAGDRVIELAGGGIDRVFSSVSFDFGVQELEHLTLTGTAAIDGFGNALANIIAGNAGANLLRGGAGNDTITGGGGADTLEPGSGFDRVEGGAGNDLYRVTIGDLSSSDLIADEAGAADTLEMLDFFNEATQLFTGISISGALGGRIQGIEHFILGSGNDTFLPLNTIGDSAGADVMTVFGGAGNDRLDVSAVDRLTTPLAFLLTGGDGADTLIGGAGADTLMPDNGVFPDGANDRAFGGLGNDLFLVLTDEFGAADTLAGEGGTDTLRFIGSAPVGADAFANISGIEVIELDQGGQQVTLPGAFADALGFTMATIRGGAGDDLVDVSAFTSTRRVYVEFGDGNDTLFGGAGNDTVVAGPGVDEIHVGEGINRVTFGEGELSAADIVTASTTGAFDTLVIGVADGQTLTSGAFAGVSGFDVFNLITSGSSAARLPGTLVSQSGQLSINVNVAGGGSMAVDGRAIASAFRMDGGTGNDTLFGGGGSDTLVGNTGDDVHVGGTGGDRIFLGTSTTSEDIALLRAVSDGTADINTTQNIAGADSVSGTEFEGNYIMVDRFGFGLPDGTTWYVNAAQNISLNYSAARLEGVSVAADDFGSLTAVRNAVGSRLTNNDPLQFEKIILVITGASNTRFGVYYFEDRDHNTTVDSLDILRLLAVGTGAGPTFGGNSGFRLTSEFELL